MLIISKHCWSFQNIADNFESLLIILNHCWLFRNIADYFESLLIISNHCWSFQIIASVNCQICAPSNVPSTAMNLHQLHQFELKRTPWGFISTWFGMWNNLLQTVFNCVCVCFRWDFDRCLIWTIWQPSGGVKPHLLSGMWCLWNLTVEQENF